MTTTHMVGFSGHQGLPPHTAELVTTALRDTMRTYTPNLVGVTLLGPGADQLFARVVLELGGVLYVVSPTAGAQYRDSFEDDDARRGYDELSAKAGHFERLDFTESNGFTHMEAGKVVVDRSTVLVAVWDGEPSRGYGGTADVVAHAKDRNVPVTVVWPEGATR
jgi:hypothetical protein